MSRSFLKNLVLMVLASLTGWADLSAQGMTIGHDQAHLEDLKSIPPEWIDSAKSKLRIVYWHTSHGGHITTGMSRLDAFLGGNGLYTRAEENTPGVLYLVDYFGDLSAGEATWPQTTRDYLDDPANQDINVVMWSWCQILGHDGDEDPGYCSKMDSLIAEYGPSGSKIISGERSVPVRFVYMTGHVNGQGEEGRTNQINNYIRNHCITHDRILYDFADIESWDPDDSYFLDDSVTDDCSYMVNGERTGNWAEEWILGKIQMDGEDDTLHSEPNGGDWYQCVAEHTHPVNANMKAYAAWYMFARLAGWRILVTSLEIKSPGDSSTITTDGGTLQLSAEILPEAADDTTFTWSVIPGTGSATITESGLLQALSNGSVTVVATANDGSGVSDSLEVTLSNQIVPVSSITLSGEGGSTSITQDKGTLQIRASILPADATDTTLSWEVISGTGQADISESGLLKAHRNGTVTVVATANDGSGVSDSLLVTITNQVIRVTSISLSGEGGSTTIEEDNGTLQIHARVSPASAEDTSLTWSVRNGTGIASISQTGLLTALYNGTVTVVASANDGSGVSDSLQVTISNQFIILVSSISLHGAGGASSIDLDQGSLQIYATVLPSNADDTTVTWSVRNHTGEASISQTGLLRASSNGMVTVVATANDSSAVSDSLKVTISGQTTGLDDPDDPGLIIRTDQQNKLLHVRWKDPTGERRTVRIYTLLGRLVYQQQVRTGQLNIDLSALDTGYYILHITPTKEAFAPYKFLVK